MSIGRPWWTAGFLLLVASCTARTSVQDPAMPNIVILFADDPTFRGFWRGLDRLVLSCILFAPSM